MPLSLKFKEVNSIFQQEGLDTDKLKPGSCPLLFYSFLNSGPIGINPYFWLLNFSIGLIKNDCICSVFWLHFWFFNVT